MERPKPTSRLITEVCGEDNTLISSFHHGLYETPLNEIYSNLNFDELAAFAASSWKSREKKNSNFGAVVNGGDIYRIFDEALGIGMPWLNRYKKISSTNAVAYDKLNPFKGHTLQARLGRVEKDSIDKFLKNLREDSSVYVFEVNYGREKALRGGDNHKLVPMTFQNVYPKKGKIVPAYAGEIRRILSGYPTSYEPLILQSPSPQSSNKKPSYTQSDLFKP